LLVKDSEEPKFLILYVPSLSDDFAMIDNEKKAIINIIIFIFVFT
jgi:hypothetical protein